MNPACAVCGGAARPKFRVPQPEMAPDLDLRPGEPARSTLSEWVRTCRGCGACAPDLTALPANTAEVIQTAAYRDCEGSPATLPFRRWAMLAPDPAEILLQAAWSADDCGLDEEAAELRRRAAALWPASPNPEQACRLVDVLRRAGEFDRAKRAIEAVSARDESIAAILSFQRARIAAGDRGRYLMSAALRPPAHAPHVSHGKRSRGGLLSRLLGR